MTDVARASGLQGPGARDSVLRALFSATQEQGRVRVVLATIARRDAELLLLRSDGIAYNQIAIALSLKPASVGTLLSRAKSAFRNET